MDSLQPHIRCSRQDGAAYAILPGDPARVERIKGFLEDVKEIAFNREHKSVSGIYKGVRVMAVSTGMGGASTGIAVEELHHIGVKNMIRIGSCGALQRDIHMGDLLLIHGAVRDDGASRSYVEEQYPAVPDTELLMCMVETAKTDREDEIDAYWHEKGILGADMETAALFTIGALRGVKTASVLNTVSLFEGNLEEEINGYVEGIYQAAEGEKNEILLALETIVRMEEKVREQEAGR